VSRSGPVYETSPAHAPDWRDQSECRATRLDGTPVHDIEDFFPAGNTSKGDLLRIATAKEICERCPVKAKCLAWSLEHREPFGIWAGLTEQERALELRRAQRARTAGQRIGRDY
jgi:WhiB family redox-sensing transcriptional regulator